MLEFEFLTGVNLQGVETYRDEQEDDNAESPEKSRRESDFNQYQPYQPVSKNTESYLPENPVESQSQGIESAKLTVWAIWLTDLMNNLETNELAFD